MDTRLLLIWSGRGLLGLGIFALSLSLPLIAAAFWVNSFPNAAAPWMIPAAGHSGLFTGGFLCWWFGRTWHKTVPAASGHALYFVPIDYWGIALMLFVIVQVVRWLAW